MANALIIVDVQNDFVEGGSLGVPGGLNLAERIAEKLESVFPTMFDHIVYTQDWHIEPGDHFSNNPDFVDSWPVHCVANEPGSEIAPVLREVVEKNADNFMNIRKGMYDASYSGFDGVDADDNKLEALLKNLGVDEVTIVGIAAEHCVRATALDAAEAGFRTTVWSDYTVGIDEDRVNEVLDTELPENGVKVI